MLNEAQIDALLATERNKPSRQATAEEVLQLQRFLQQHSSAEYKNLSDQLDDLHITITNETNETLSFTLKRTEIASHYELQDSYFCTVQKMKRG